MNTTSENSAYFVVAREPGAEHPALPTWANHQANIVALNDVELTQTERTKVSKKMLAEVPGAFQLLNVLSADECKRLISASETMGFLPDAAVSLPRHVRHNDSLTWVVDNTTEQVIWDRVKHLMNDTLGIFDGKAALGLNNRFRFYRYNEDDFFKPHSDGSWPGSQVIDGELVRDAFGDRYSQLTFLILLTEDFEGGATRFLVNADNPHLPAKHGDNVKTVDVRTPAGSVLCFPHGMHPLHCIHSSEPIYQGIKYIIRTDVLFEL